MAEELKYPLFVYALRNVDEPEAAPDPDRLFILIDRLVNSFSFAPKAFANDVYAFPESYEKFRVLAFTWVSALAGAEEYLIDGRNEIARDKARIIAASNAVTGAPEAAEWASVLCERMIRYMHRTLQQSFSSAVFAFLANEYPALKDSFDGIENWWRCPMI